MANMSALSGITGIGELQSTLAIDTQALGALRAQAKNTPDAALQKVATQFEALFMQMMLKSMRDSVPQDGLLDSEATRTYMSMFDQQMSTSLAGKSGLGLADVLVRQLRGMGGVGSAPGAQALDPAGGLQEPPYPFFGPNSIPSSIPTSIQKTVPSVNPFRPGEGYRSPERVAPAQDSAAPAPAPAPAPARAPASVREHVRVFIDKVATQAIAAARETGVPARFIAAQAALESNWGRNEIRGADGAPSHNLFGIKATGGWHGKTAEAVTTEYVNGVPVRTTEKFRAYDSYSEAFLDYAKLLKARYKEAVAAGDNAANFALGLQRGGYATDPRYAEKIERIIQTNFSARG